MRIHDFISLKRFFETCVQTPIVGAGVYAFHRLGPEEFVSPYRIVALRSSLETELIEKDIEVFSLEKGMGTKHIEAPRNATTVLLDERTQKYLKQSPGALLLVYKSSEKLERVASEMGWRIAANPVRFGKILLENKITFRRILENLGVPVPPGEIFELSETERDLELDRPREEYRRRYEHFGKTYGVPFVLQHPTRGGGKGTFFVSSWEEFWLRLKGLADPESERPQELLVSRYVEGPSPSITGCVTRHGILSTSLQHQILAVPTLYSPSLGSGLFCGHDWSSSRFSEKILLQAYEIVDRVGRHLATLGYKGIFGLDFVLDEKNETLSVTECNPRLLGSFPVLTMIQQEHKELPILAFHLLEYLGIDYEIDAEEINKQMRTEKEGAQMMMHNVSGRWARNQNQIPAGVYRLEPGSSKPQFIRSGYALKHIKNNDEFLITEGVPLLKSHFSPNRRIVRIITKRAILEHAPHILNVWAEEVTRSVYDAFSFRPVRFAKLRKLLNPQFLAKG